MSIKTVSFFFALLRTSIRSSISVKGAFLLESLLMIINNLIFLFLWWIFFNRVNDIAGWNINDMMALMAIVTGAYGLMQIAFGGTKYIAKIVLSGDLDPFLTQPKNTLLHLTASRSVSKGWGNLMTSGILIIIGHLISPSIIALILISMFCGCLIFTSLGVIAQSAAFWFGSIEAVAKKYSDSLYLFALYPTNIYSGILKIIIFTVIPAGVITYLPVELLRNFSWSKLFLLLSSAALFVFLAFFIFNKGLRHYESGNKFGIRL